MVNTKLDQISSNVMSVLKKIFDVEEEDTEEEESYRTAVEN